MEQFGAILEGEVSALLATDRYAGGGFDHARLDTLLLGAYRLPAASGFCARPESAG